MSSRPFALFAVVFAAAAAAAQTPAFEVGSVKPQIDARPGVVSSSSGNRFYRPAITVRSLILFAYDLPPFRVIAGQDWIDSDWWTIDARAPAPATLDEMRLMVRGLLSDRFKLTTHIETRELPIYELHLARRDGTLGPNAKPAGDCTPIGVRSREEVRAAGAITCGPGNVFLRQTGSATQHFRGVPMSTFAANLEPALGRVVADKTGVNGLWDLELTYAYKTLVLPPSLGQLAREPDAPPLFTALQEQLGLKLEASRGPVEVLVIDTVQRPAPD